MRDHDHAGHLHFPRTEPVALTIFRWSTPGPHLVHAVVHTGWAALRRGRVAWCGGLRVEPTQMIIWSDVMAWVAAVPSGVWGAAAVGNVVLTAATWSTARRRVRGAGQRTAQPDPVPRGRGKDTALTLAS